MRPTCWDRWKAASDASTRLIWRAATRCRSAVAELTGMPALLAMLDLDDVLALESEQPDPPLRPEVLQSVLAKVSWGRRRSRWVTTAAVGVAAALLAIGVVVGVRPEVFGLHSGTEQQTLGDAGDEQGRRNARSMPASR